MFQTFIKLYYYYYYYYYYQLNSILIYDTNMLQENVQH